MFKRILSGLLAAIIMSTGVYAAEPADSVLEAQELVFEPVGEGKFIYCNNPEAIMEDTLVDSDAPRYIMNNENLGPGKYYIYLSHYNFLGGNGKPGSDMELDVELTPVSGNCEYTLSNIGFETTRPFVYYNVEQQNSIYGQNDWALLGCCASTLGIPIVQLDGDRCYTPIDNGTHNITANSTRWLSEFITNYAKVHYREPVHIQAILEIKSGNLNANVCAFKADGELGDRSDFRSDAEFGLHRYDRTIKGISDTLPQVVAELEYTIDDTVTDGTRLPMSLHNQYAPDGIIQTQWVTNINPVSDPWAKARADESGMLSIQYKDNSKLQYYGKNVPETERDNIWRFDTKHTDTHKYEGQPATNGADNYSPNYAVTAADNVGDYACCLGNYGITYTYDMAITNNSNSTRYFTYELTTASNAIVYTNENGKEAEYAYAKGGNWGKETDVMSVVELPPNKTTEFSVNMILPVNYNGGMDNSFIIRDKAQMPDAAELLANYNKRDYKEPPLTGHYLSDFENKLPEETLKEFAGTLDCYEILDCEGYYAVRWCEWDYTYQSYQSGWSDCSDIYFLNSAFKITDKHRFDSLPIDMQHDGYALYIQTAQNGIFSKGWASEWTAEPNLTTIPNRDTPLGNRLDEKDFDLHTVSFSVCQTTLTDSEYETFYKAVKSIPLIQTMVAGQTGPPCVDIDGLDLFNVIKTHNFVIKPIDGNANFLHDYLISLLYFGENGKAKEWLNLSDWAYNDIKDAYSYGLGLYLTATPKYDHQQGITRRQFCELVAKVLNNSSIELPNSTEIKFSDTSDRTVRGLAKLGVIKGYDDGSFRPDNTITREEAAVILSRLIGLFEMADKSDVTYADNANIQDWAQDGVKVATNYGIMKGVEDNRFDPEGIYTIEQSIVTMLRAFNCIADNGHLELPVFPKGGNRATVYREGYRNNRIELAVYNTENDSKLINDNGVLSVSGSYDNSVKYFLCCGRWVEFERGYERISNNATAVLFSGE